jgi:hypothetical protein
MLTSTFIGNIMGYVLVDWGSIRDRGSVIFSTHRVQTVFVAHTVSYTMDIGGSFPGGKAAGA